MSEWRKKQLQEIAFLKPTETLKKGDIAPNIPMANIKEFQRDVVKIDYGEFRGGTKFRNGDTLLAKITPCLENGKTAFVNCLQEDEIGFGSTEFIVLRAKENIDERFLYYLSISPEFRKQAISLMEGTSGRKRVNENALKISDFLIPDFEEQRKIANILSAIDDKIQINNQINQELEVMAKTLYDYWFVQFDFPDQNGKPYKSSGGKMVYNPELKREIPEGWGVESLVDNTLSTVIKPGIDEFTQKTYLATADVVNTSIKGGRLITYDNRETRANMQPSVNSVWFAKMKSSNKHLFLSHSMKELIDSTILSTGFMGLQCKEESFEYLASFISDPDFEIFKDKLSHGATQQAVNVNDLKSILVTIPDDYTLHEFHKKVKSIFLNIGRNTVEDKYLNSLRDWLLPMLMNGQVKVE